MVVCKCRKATKLYCFVHKVPVCGECICFREHQICVVRAYSEWVIDGEYDWPPKCCLCQDALEEGTASQTTRLGCLHIVHTNCLISYINKFPLHTAPAGYVCPACSIPIWPPKCVKDSGSQLHSQLKEAIMQSGLEKNLFGSYPVSLPTKEHHAPPPAFASDPLIHIPRTTTGGEFNANSPSSVLKDQIASEGYTAETGGRTTSVSDIVEVDGSNSAGNFIKSSDQAGLVDWNTTQPVATTRKGAFHNDRANHEVSYYADDEDGNSKKYTRRGPFRLKFLRALLPFWSTALPTLPVTVPPRKDALNADDLPEGRSRHQRSSRVDPRKLLLVLAIMACMATMGVLYYRLVQRGLGEELLDDEKQ